MEFGDLRAAIGRLVGHETPRGAINRKLGDPIIRQAFENRISGVPGHLKLDDVSVTSGLQGLGSIGIIQQGEHGERLRIQPTERQLADPGFYHPDKVKLLPDFVREERTDR